MEPCVSIIVPSYKVEKYLDRCMKSLMTQSLKDIEIIIVDDGSPDKCGEMADQYAAQDKRIIVVHQANGGLSAARNAGLARATGEYVAFIDSDDWVELTMMEELYKAASTNQADMTVCGHRRLREDETVIATIHAKEALIHLADYGRDEYVVDVPFSHRYGNWVWNKLYRRKLIVEKNIIFEHTNEICEEDALFNLYVLCHAQTICGIQAPLYNYYVKREGSITSQWHSYFFIERHMQLIDRFARYATAWSCQDFAEAICPYLLTKYCSEILFIVSRTERLSHIGSAINRAIAATPFLHHFVINSLLKQQCYRQLQRWKYPWKAVVLSRLVMLCALLKVGWLAAVCVKPYVNKYKPAV